MKTFFSSSVIAAVALAQSHYYDPRHYQPHLSHHRNELEWSHGHEYGEYRHHEAPHGDAYYHQNSEATHHSAPLHPKPEPPHGFLPHHVQWDHDNEVWMVNSTGEDEEPLSLYYDPENGWMSSLGKMGSEIGAGVAKAGSTVAKVGKAAYAAAPTAAQVGQFVDTAGQAV
jgi:hypothetical protein